MIQGLGSRFLKYPKYSDFDLINSFIPIQDEFDKYHLDYLNPQNFYTCPQCGEKPRIWCFDNGRHAACKCYTRYDKCNVSAISVGEYGLKNNWNLLRFPLWDLVKEWNKRCVVARLVMRELVLTK